MLERLLNNWPLKALSVFLACATWIAVTGQGWIVQDLRVPLDVRLPADRSLASAPPTAVTVRLRGPEGLFRKLDPLLLVLRPDLADVSTGRLEVLLTDDDLSGVPVGLEVAFIEPARVSLVLEERLRRELPVKPQLAGSVPRGYALYHARVEPPTLIVEGPESELRPLAHVGTSAVHVDGRTGSFEQRVSALPEGAHLHIVDAGPLVVHAIIDTEPVERIFEGIPLASDGATVRVRVAVAGPQALLERLRAEQLVAVPQPEHGVRVDVVGVAADELARLRARVLGHPS